MLMRSSAFAVGLLASPVALMAQTTLNARVDSVVTQTAANSTSINFVWTLVAGFLVMFMQAGFALVETGFTRSKNAGHTMTMNFMVYAIGMLAYWAVGFALQAGGIGALATLGGYLLSIGLPPRQIFLSACLFALVAAAATALLVFRGERTPVLTPQEAAE